MTYNDILRRTRYALDLSDATMLEILARCSVTISEETLQGYMGKSGEPHAVDCPAEILTAFLDGLILELRGPREGGAPPVSSTEALTNNVIFKKLRIALSLHEKDVLGALAAGGMKLSKGELSALFRSPEHKHFRPCGDQILRNFLNGLTRLRRSPQPDNPAVPPQNPWKRPA